MNPLWVAFRPVTRSFALGCTLERLLHAYSDPATRFIGVDEFRFKIWKFGVLNLKA